MILGVTEGVVVTDTVGVTDGLTPGLASGVDVTDGVGVIVAVGVGLTAPPVGVTEGVGVDVGVGVGETGTSNSTLLSSPKLNPSDGTPL